MTFYEEDEVVPELRVRVGEEGEGNKGDYVDLGMRDRSGNREAERDPPSPRRCRRFVWYLAKLFLLFSCLGLLAGVCIKWVWPFLMDKVGVAVGYKKNLLRLCFWMVIYVDACIWRGLMFS